jgi:hypothetical protein
MPVTPVVRPRPVALVRVNEVGVSRLGLIREGLLDKTTEPDPVDVVAPVPPLITFTTPVIPLAGAAMLDCDAAVINPLPFTVNVGLILADPNEPTFEFTVDRVKVVFPGPIADPSPVS